MNPALLILLCAVAGCIILLYLNQYRKNVAIKRCLDDVSMMLDELDANTDTCDFMIYHDWEKPQDQYNYYLNMRTDPRLHPPKIGDNARLYISRPGTGKFAIVPLKLDTYGLVVQHKINLSHVPSEYAIHNWMKEVNLPESLRIRLQHYATIEYIRFYELEYFK